MDEKVEQLFLWLSVNAVKRTSIFHGYKMTPDPTWEVNIKKLVNEVAAIWDLNRSEVMELTKP